ncbi:unnamed protein product [Microthlaspi erraticum]|uniref:Legume lectin domain-containing protein n=1 Tax=Microthlaspi erraticum TaxID=1685480 RepID=A0A6D2L1N4_9BRAS|nr:unnamed protein product [Microthlaspi erraticum]
MLVKQLLTMVFFFFSLLSQFLKSSSQSLHFTYNGFRPPLTDLSLQGIATVTPNGLLKLTNATSQNRSRFLYQTNPVQRFSKRQRLVLLYNLCLRHQPSAADA